MDYIVLEHIGAGGFGNVEKIKFTNGKIAAKKTFHPYQKLDNNLFDNVKNRFVREVQMLNNIHHANIMPIIGYDINVDPPYYIMPMASSSLSEDLKDLKNSQYILSVLLDILSGLEELHSLGIVHRDLKPQNILKLSDRYVISDFGLISIKDTQISQLTQTGFRMSSDFYTAPEIVCELKNASPASDIFSFGCILHDFFGTTQRIPCQPIYDPDAQLSEIITICTRSNPEERFQTVSDLRESVVELFNNLTNPVAPVLNLNSNFYFDENAGFDSKLLSDLIRKIDKDSIERNNVFNNISRSNIDKLIEHYNMSAPNSTIRTNIEQFIKLYSIWIKDSQHIFAQCDVLSGYLEKFYLIINSVEVRAYILLSLLIMGTSHNRWYVEEKFMKYAIEANEKLCQRFVLESRILGRVPHNAINHLEWSIKKSRNLLPPILRNYFREDRGV